MAGGSRWFGASWSKPKIAAEPKSGWHRVTAPPGQLEYPRPELAPTTRSGVRTERSWRSDPVRVEPRAGGTSIRRVAGPRSRYAVWRALLGSVPTTAGSH